MTVLTLDHHTRLNTATNTEDLSISRILPAMPIAIFNGTWLPGGWLGWQTWVVVYGVEAVQVAFEDVLHVCL